MGNAESPCSPSLSRVTGHFGAARSDRSSGQPPQGASRDLVLGYRLDEASHCALLAINDPDQFVNSHLSRCPSRAQVGDLTLKHGIQLPLALQLSLNKCIG